MPRMSLSSLLRRSTRFGFGLVMTAQLSGCSDNSSPTKASGGSTSQAGTSSSAGKSSSDGGKPSAGGQTSSSGGKTASTEGGAKASGGSSGGKSGSGSGSGGTTPIGGGTSTAADIARKLGHDANFLIGLGNDLPSDYMWDKASVYHRSTKLDLHYIYLTHGWQDWNAGGYFAQIIANVDLKNGVTPMSTVWATTGEGENNFDVLVKDDYMKIYWDEAKLLMQRYAELDTPALVHVEPDFWAYAQQKSGGDPSKVPVHLSPDCPNLPQDLSGMARCWFKLARDNAPKVVIGLHASEWGGSAADVGKFMNKLGIAEGDLVIIDMLDRDAGCFEDGKLSQCMRGGTFYLDETNQTSPNYAERLAFAKEVSTATGKPILWWQLPLGVPSDTPGGTPGHFRDNKVHYLFSHVQDFIDAGGVGATFGVGAGDQTTVETDGGQFDDAISAYFAAPVPLP
jgi:hypothetical protein